MGLDGGRGRAEGGEGRRSKWLLSPDAHGVQNKSLQQSLHVLLPAALQWWEGKSFGVPRLLPLVNQIVLDIPSCHKITRLKHNTSNSTEGKKALVMSDMCEGNRQGSQTSIHPLDVGVGVNRQSSIKWHGTKMTVGDGLAK